MHLNNKKWLQDCKKQGEIPFTNVIYKMGYKLQRFGKIDGWNQTNYLLPYYNYKNVY